MSGVDIPFVITQSERIRNVIYNLIRQDPQKHLGAAVWLKFAIGEDDFAMTIHGDRVYCYGCVFTGQTMQLENFEFDISIEDIQCHL